MLQSLSIKKTFDVLAFGISKPVSFKIVEDTDFDESEEDEAPLRGGGSCAVDPALYSMLKDLRKKMSKKLDVPPYVIFQDPSLEAIYHSRCGLSVHEDQRAKAF